MHFVCVYACVRACVCLYVIKPFWWECVHPNYVQYILFQLASVCTKISMETRPLINNLIDTTIHYTYIDQCMVWCTSLLFFFFVVIVSQHDKNNSTKIYENIHRSIHIFNSIKVLQNRYVVTISKAKLIERMTK